MNPLMMIWGKTATTIVAIVSIAAALLGIRFKIRRGAKEELSNEIRERTLERVGVANDVSNDVAGMSDADVAEQLRDNGWVRD